MENLWILGLISLLLSGIAVILKLHNKKKIVKSKYLDENLKLKIHPIDKFAHWGHLTNNHKENQ